MSLRRHARDTAMVAGATVLAPGGHCCPSAGKVQGMETMYARCANNPGAAAAASLCTSAAAFLAAPFVLVRFLASAGGGGARRLGSHEEEEEEKEEEEAPRRNSVVSRSRHRPRPPFISSAMRAPIVGG
ncbi:hypothetical protein IWW47_004636, partial [Coemansia sp. RSA 2052]